MSVTLRVQFKTMPSSLAIATILATAKNDPAFEDSDLIEDQPFVEPEYTKPYYGIPVSEVPDTLNPPAIPDKLCGIGGCVFYPHTEGSHSWQQ